MNLRRCMRSLNPRATSYHIVFGNAALCSTAKLIVDHLLWVKSGGDDRAGSTVYVRFAPIAVELLSRGGAPLRAISGREQSQPANRYSITSSARASTVAGSSKPSVLAVFRLITSSYLEGACTGRSAGFSPLRMRST